MIVWEICRQSVGDREQPLALRREIGSRGVGTTYNRRQPVECLIVDVISAYNRIERAAFANVSELDPFDVIGGAADAGGNIRNFIRRDVNEFCVGFDKPADEPWTGNAIDLGMFARHPFALGRITACGGRQAQFLPTSNAALK